MLFKPINKDHSCPIVEYLQRALNRFVEMALLPGTKSEENILLVPLCKKCPQKISCWELIEEQAVGDNNNTDIKNCRAILFISVEDGIRGDKPDSTLNKTRMLRKYFQRTSYARTCHPEDYREKVSALLLDLFTVSPTRDIKAPGEVLECLKKLLDSIKKINIIENTTKNIDLLRKLSCTYAHPNFHNIGHGLLRNIKDVLEDNRKKDISDKINYYYKTRKLYDLGSIIADNALKGTSGEKDTGFKVLVIDDKPENILEDMRNIVAFLPNNSEIHITTNKSAPLLFDPNFWKDLYIKNTERVLEVSVLKKTSQNINEKEKEEDKSLFDNNRFAYTHVVVDLLFGAYNDGNRLIRELVKFRSFANSNSSKSAPRIVFDILVLSLSDEIEDISRAFDEGAQGYIWKFGRIYSLPTLLARTKDESDRIFTKHETPPGNARNFDKLYRLPNRIIRELKGKPFLIPIDRDKYPMHAHLARRLARQWIKDIPKADIHCHLGGAMDENLVFNLAVNTLRHLKQKAREEKWSKDLNKILKIIETYASCYVQPTKYNKHEKEMIEVLNEKRKINGVFQTRVEGQVKYFRSLWCLFESNRIDCPQIIHEWLIRTKYPHEKEAEKKFVEVIEKDCAEDVFSLLSFYIKEYLVPGQTIHPDILSSIFIIYLGKMEGRQEKDISSFWENTLEFIDGTKAEVDRMTRDIAERIKRYCKIDNDKVGKKIGEQCAEIFKKINIDGPTFRPGIIRKILIADDSKAGLAAYMEGSAFSGTCHLQYYENIVAAVAYLVAKWSKDCVRYFEIRCSPTGYNSCGLTISEAVQALFDGADGMGRYLFLEKGGFIWTNFIITTKRHKSPSSMASEIATAIVNRERTIKEDLDYDPQALPRKISQVIYKWQPSKIVGVDLAGYEKNFRTSAFVEDFAPIFKTCSFLTIHAGEEEDEQSVWEAVYKLHAHRIGHALTLKDNPYLMRMARDLQLCIELCPISNCFTKIPKDNQGDHPFYQYVMEGLNVTINTDDPAWSDSDLSEEYVKAGEIFYLAQKLMKDKRPLSRWEILRIVKQGFKNAFISREDKRTLLRSIEEEVYQKVLWKEGVESLHPKLDLR